MLDFVLVSLYVLTIFGVAIPVATIAILLQLYCNPIATHEIFTMKSEIGVAIIAIFYY
ncbi:MAG: hypothetical protein IJH63_06765 [Methanobrevibacter sp.]|nr:hypothetical protein [Methanobrevibacter sp.]